MGLATDKLGISLCMLTAFFFGLSITMAKLAFSYGMSPMTFAAARAFSSVVVCIAMALVFKSQWRLPKSAGSEVLPVTVLFLLMAFGYPAAMKYVPASIAALTFYLFPLIVLTIGSIKERRFPGIRRVSIYLAAFAGLGIVLAPSFEGLNWLGIVYGMIAALGAALFTLKIPKIMSETNGMVVNVYANGLNVIVLLGAALVFGEFMFPGDAMGWFVVSLAGVFFGVATALVVFAVKRTGPVLASIFFNLEPLVVTILAAILFAELLAPVQYIGILIVMGAVMFASWRTAE